MKRKILSAVLILCMLAAFVPCGASAETYGDFEYERNDLGITITAYTGNGGDVVIPDKIDNLPVTSIGICAFDVCYGLTSVTIPDSVTKIGRRAFGGCSNLKDVYITDIAKWCEINFVSYDSNPFYYADNLYINDVLTTELIIPNGAIRINRYAFYKCSSLTSVTIPDSVISIGDDVFYGCSSLTSVTLGSGVTNINGRAFSNCGYLNISVDENNTNFCGMNGVLFNKNKSEIIAYSKDKIQPDYTIPNGVTSIGEYAFYCRYTLTSITIPDSVTSIGNEAFDACYGLTSVTIPDSVTSIGDEAFSYCDGLTSVTMSSSIINIGEGAFYYCHSLTNITIPDTVTSIGICAFEGCDNLTSIGDYAFKGCYGLTNVTIPDNVTSIGEGAFLECGSLDISVDQNNTGYCDINGVLFNKNKSEIIAYSKDKIQPDYTIPDGVTSIGNSAFYDCDSLTSVTIPDGVTSIGNYAFFGCGCFTSVTIPDSITSIGDAAFEGCSSLNDVYYGGSETDWENIRMGYSNYELEDATIHYNTTTIPVPETPEIGNISYENGECTFTAEVENIPYTTNLISVLYDQSGTVVGMDFTKVKPTDATAQVTITGENAKCVKVFIWDSLGGMRPLCEAATVQIV